jgi:hypothetical protein
MRDRIAFAPTPRNVPQAIDASTPSRTDIAVRCRLNGDNALSDASTAVSGAPGLSGILAFSAATFVVERSRSPHRLQFG